jgi:ornithine cyclodeaminase/alanine dehydrogenase-like protein (mu-crystallin family)
MQEIPPETVKRAIVVVDSRSASLTEAGDLVKAILQGHITTKHIHAELGEILLGRKPGRTTPEQITFFKSVGVAVQDAAAASLAMRNAQKSSIGQRVNF